MVCRRAFPDVSFPAALEDIVLRLGTERHRSDPHFMAQSRFCGGLGSTLHYYQTVRVLRPERSHADVRAMLRSVGVGADAAARAMKRTFPRTAAARRRCASCHSTNAQSTVGHLLNGTLLSLVRQHYTSDQRLLLRAGAGGARRTDMFNYNA